MFLAEPAPTSADLHFRLFGFPIRVSPWFWAVAFFMGMGGMSKGKADPTNTLIWVVVVFISILVHELGHAFMQRRYGGRPWITLFALGGLASCEDCDRSPKSQIIISAAGPIAGFCLATLVVLLLLATGHLNGFQPRIIPVDWIPYDLQFIAENGRLSPRDEIVWTLLVVNIFWGLVNLLPIYPLDGGRISRELFTLQGNPQQGIVRSLWLSAITAGLVAGYALLTNGIFLAIMFGYLAYQSYQTIQAYQNFGSGQRW